MYHKPNPPTRQMVDFAFSRLPTPSKDRGPSFSLPVMRPIDVRALVRGEFNDPGDTPYLLIEFHLKRRGDGSYFWAYEGPIAKEA